MRTEDKELLIKDLCARLPYETKMLFNNKHKFILSQINPRQFAGKDGYGVIFDFGDKIYSVEDCKPYLRPISSMTDDEMDRLFDILRIDKDGKDEDWIKINDVYGIKFFFPTGKWIEDVAEAYDYLYSIHIDFRGLIRKSLAIEAPKGMYL